MDKIKLILNSLEAINTFDVVVYDMRGKSPFYDYFVIASATSDRQLQAAIAHISTDVTKAGYDHPRVEGKNSNSWILVDCKDIIVNVFTKDERAFYNLEKMLAEIPEIDIEHLK